MKHNYLYLKIVFVLAVGVLFFLQINNNEARKYSSRENQSEVSFSAKGAHEYLTSIRANQNTGTIDVKDVENAQKQLKALSSKKEGSLPWINRGPDNIGGRTRALLIDRENSNLMFAGGISGGIWKSTTAGQNWESVEYGGVTSEDFANLAVSSICQTSNGDIYFGTGEGFGSTHGGNIHTPMILGAGIWKSSDNGQTFNKLESTWTTDDDMNIFSLVNKMAADPSDPNLVYAATRKGLKMTTDGGATWVKAPMPDITFDNSYSTDVKIATDGSVIASVGNKCLVKKAGESSFVNRSGMDESDGGDLITTSDVGRLEFAYSPEDPNYVFCAVATNDGELRNIYKSEDGGDTWKIAGNGGSSLFQPLGDQGIYDMCIAVNPLNKDQLFIGGLDLWVGNAATTGSLFSWIQISLWNIPPTNPNYIHADLHTIIFDPKNPETMFIGSDGGVSRGYINKDNIPFQFRTMNKNYSVTQFYSVACNNKGYVLGGTQDNGSIMITGEGNTESTGRPVRGGDGGHVAMSQINPSIAYATIYYGGLWRNNDQDYVDWNFFYNSKISDFHSWPPSGWVSDTEKQQASFVTPIAYWETDNDPNSDDEVMFIARRDYPADTTIDMYSHNIFKAPISVTLDKDYNTKDTFYYDDPYASLFALGMARTVWLTRKAANWNSPITYDDWWQALEGGTLSSDEYITQMVFSNDGDHLFFSTSQNEIYRLSNLNNARTFNDADYKLGKNIITELTKIGGAGSRTITGIAVDPNDVDNIIVTLGNYGNSSYVYLCTKASVATLNSSLTNFINITGGLPKAPVYCALFEMDNTTERVMLGTDMGVFMSEGLFEQVSSTSGVEWTATQEGVGPVPVFQITQQTKKYPGTVNYGRIYIGTHGLGFFEDRTYQSIFDDELPDSKSVVAETLDLSIFPNPVVNSAKVSIELKHSGNVNLEIVNMSGQIVYKVELGNLSAGDNTIDVQVGDINSGVYLLKVNTGGLSGTTRFVKK